MIAAHRSCQFHSPYRPSLQRRVLVIALRLLVAGVLLTGAAQQSSAADESLFVQKLYPILQTAQCGLCHSDNGVGSETSLKFPSESANQEQIAAFGLQLMDFVDSQNVGQSLLLLKPTNREEHTGGERIAPGSAEEQTLRAWIQQLAQMDESQREQARRRIAEAQKFDLQPLTIRRLTHSQYNHTVRDLLGDRTQPASAFPKEDFIHGFQNQIEGLSISPLLAEAYSRAAERLASAAFRGGDHQHLIPTAEGRTPDDVASAFVQAFGRRAFRRPLRDEESAHYIRLFRQEAASQTRDPRTGARIVVEAMLQSPHFLFRIEHGPGSEFEQYEIACRLSYALWDTMPTDEMLQAAADKRFSSVEDVESYARSMLDDPRARTALSEFLAQWLRFDRVLTATRDRRRFRDFNQETAAAMVEETQRLFEHLVWTDQNFMEFFTADYTFINSRLAEIYGLPAPGQEFEAVKYPAESGRSGILGHASFLTATSKPGETSPTERGLFVRNHFLGQEVPSPPPGVNTNLPAITEDRLMTNRQRLDLHLNSEACASCHRLIDPIGLGLEQYNAIGGFEEQMVLQFGSEYGDRPEKDRATLPIDTAAYIQGLPDSDFQTPRELGAILARSETCQRCIVKQLFRYTFGRQETDSDQVLIDSVLQRFQQSGFRFREILLGLVTSDLFLQRGSSK